MKTVDTVLCITRADVRANRSQPHRSPLSAAAPSSGSFSIHMRYIWTAVGERSAAATAVDRKATQRPPAVNSQSVLCDRSRRVHVLPLHGYS